MKNTSLPYIKQGNIFHVPTIPQRLSFAVLVKRAVKKLKLDKRDVIAVSLPNSIRWKVQEALERLPEVSLVVAWDVNDNLMEVFPIAPCDGIVEAIRIAEEQKLPLQFVDSELNPENLLERSCLAEPTWADDWYAVERGTEEYLSLISDRVSRHPLRYEPLDTWREKFMALQLRRLGEHYRRILFICPAPHVNPIRELLKNQYFGPEVENSVAPTKFDILKPSLELFLRYLDDFPRLVQRYEECRSENDLAESFDKRTALLKEIIYFAHNTKQFSRHHYEAFSKLFPTILEFDRCITPGLKDIYTIAESCFGRDIARDVQQHLLGYYDQLKVDFIVEYKGTLERTALTHSDDSTMIFVARDCNPLHHNYQILPLTNVVPNIRLWAWPQWRKHYNKMRHRVYELAYNSEVQRVSSKYRGSLEDGLDARKTLLSYLRGEHTIFVKHRRTQKKFVEIDGNEPIVWLFESIYDAHPIGKRDVLLRKTNIYLTYSFFYDEEKIFYYKETEKKLVKYFKGIGGVSFGRAGITVNESKARFGSEAEFFQRVPTTMAFEESIGYSSIWWEQLFYMAIKYAKKYVFVVLPDDMIIPTTVIQKADASSKKLCITQLSRLGKQEMDKLSRYYSIDKRCIVDFHIDEFVIDQYNDIMKPLWP